MSAKVATAKAALAAMRADQWLWSARFYKTRSLAKQAIEGGKVEINDARCKPAKLVHLGDRVKLTRGVERLEVSVMALIEKRGPATVAASMYSESPESAARREKEAEAQRLARMAFTPSMGRPSKRDRRDIHQFEQLARDSGKD